jgi:hypothetical protein
MFKKTIFVVAVAALLVLWAGKDDCLHAQYRGEGQAPIKMDGYAAKVIRPGDTWMIFLQAEDPKGDMTSIAAVLWQAGVGYYPTEVTMLKPEESKEISGYLYMRTPAEFELNWDEFELTLIIRDSKGNRSQGVTFPLTFDMAAPKQEVPEKWQEASKHSLEAIGFDLESSSLYNRGGNGRFD